MKIILSNSLKCKAVENILVVRIHNVSNGFGGILLVMIRALSFLESQKLVDVMVSNQHETQKTLVKALLEP